MKVIHQLISYFDERERLSEKHIAEFVNKGFWGFYKSADLRSLERRIDETFFFEVTGQTHGALWGTETFTSDSALEVACVHAGVLRPGESGVVKVTIVKPLAVFQGSTRNGVASHTWTTGWSGAYKVEGYKK